MLIKFSLQFFVQTRLKVVSRHIMKTIHWWSLERAGPDPLRSWSPDSLARHVLLALDELVMALKCQSLRCYFHPRCNVMFQCAKGKKNLYSFYINYEWNVPEIFIILLLMCKRRIYMCGVLSRFAFLLCIQRCGCNIGEAISQLALVPYETSCSFSKENEKNQ